jgi:glycine/D-amino acid oxidase-like deaminating enzyme
VNDKSTQSLSALDADVRARISTYAQTHGAEVTQLLQSYSRSWSSALSRSERAELIAAIWEPEGSYSDPTAVDVSPADLVDHIEKMLRVLGPVKLRPCGTPFFYAGRTAFSWEFVTEDGAQLSEISSYGTDFARISERFRLLSITGFFGSVIGSRAS